jgi:phage virion morphogenesis protein
MLTIKLDKGDVPTALAQVLSVLDKPRPLLQAIGEYGIDSTMARFRTGTAPDGTKWAPKSKTTLARHPRGGRKPLIGESKVLSTTIAYQVSDKSVEWGSNRVYAAVQQFGAEAGSLWRGEDSRGRKGKAPWGKIPARPYLGLSAKDERNIMEIVRDYLL